MNPTTRRAGEGGGHRNQSPEINNRPRWAKCFVFTWELNLLLSCFGLSALYMRLYCNSWPCIPPGPASLNHGTGTVLNASGKLGSTWQKTCRPSPFSHLAFLFIYDSDVLRLFSGRLNKKYPRYLIGQADRLQTKTQDWWDRITIRELTTIITLKSMGGMALQCHFFQSETSPKSKSPCLKRWADYW